MKHPCCVYNITRTANTLSLNTTKTDEIQDRKINPYAQKFITGPPQKTLGFMNVIQQMHFFFYIHKPKGFCWSFNNFCAFD